MELRLMIFLILFAKVFSFNLTFNVTDVKVYVEEEVQVGVILHENRQVVTSLNWTTISEPTGILQAELNLSHESCDYDFCNDTLTVRGESLGLVKVFLASQHTENKTKLLLPVGHSTIDNDQNTSFQLNRMDGWRKLHPHLKVAVLRRKTVANQIFSIFIAVVISLNNINMGCALDLKVVKRTLKKPIGPAIGFFCQFVMMPLVSYGAGYLMFDDPILRLGLFTFGSSPGGGASNMWTVLLNGNLNLSITMTFVSTMAALGTIPLWLFTLGRTITKETNITIPFTNILVSIVSLTIPIVIGLLVQRFFPKLAARSKKILAPVSLVLIIAIIVMASVLNTYIFRMMTWRMVVAASISSWSGFAFGALASLVFRFKSSDVVAVAVETGIQNTGIAFVLLTYSLAEPESDIAGVVPVTGAIITPVPLFVIFCFLRCRNWLCRSDNFELNEAESKAEKEEGAESCVDEEKNTEM